MKKKKKKKRKTAEKMAGRSYCVEGDAHRPRSKGVSQTSAEERGVEASGVGVTGSTRPVALRITITINIIMYKK